MNIIQSNFSLNVNYEFKAILIQQQIKAVLNDEMHILNK